jgi:hypothetical protein
MKSNACHSWPWRACLSAGETRRLNSRPSSDMLQHRAIPQIKRKGEHLYTGVLITATSHKSAVSSQNIGAGRGIPATVSGHLALSSIIAGP